MVTSHGIRPVVSLFGDYGSGAEEIGPRVAERLGVPFVAQAISSHQIARAPADEVGPSRAWQRCLSSVSLGSTWDADLARGTHASSDHAGVAQNTRFVTGADPQRAAELIVHEDYIRSALAQQLYDWDPGDDTHFDVVLNTATFTYEHIVDIVVEAYRHKYPDDDAQDAAPDA